MTADKARKRAVRERMAETGEKYMQARTALLNGPLHLLTIINRYGDSHELHVSEEAAKDSLFAYVEQNWEQDGPKAKDGQRLPMPQDRDEAIEDYFEHSASYAGADESYSIEELTVGGAPAPKPLDVDKLDLGKLDRDELVKLVRRVNEEYDGRSETSFLDELKKALAAAGDVQELVEKHGPVVRAAFSTWDWDNGWFFNEHAPVLAFADGTVYDTVDLFAADSEYSHAMANVSQSYQPLGASATYVVNLVTGDTDEDDYGDNDFSYQKKVEETTVVHLGSTSGEQYGWECSGCDEVSGLQWGSGGDARKALDNHIKELHTIGEETK